MSKILNGNFIVFSHSRPSNIETVLELLDIEYISGIGVLKGVREECFIVGYTDIVEKFIFGICGLDNQESILFVHENKRAVLYSVEGTIWDEHETEFLGYWTEVEQETDNCTIIGKDIYTTTLEGK